MSEHTPTPWSIDPESRVLIYAGEDNTGAYRYVATCHSTVHESDEPDEANAAFIVACVNSHEALVANLTNLVGLASQRGRLDEYGAAIADAKAAMAKAQP